jgi:hypothetical protein
MLHDRRMVFSVRAHLEVALIGSRGRQQVPLGLLRRRQVEPRVSRERVGFQALLIGGRRLDVGLGVAEGVP